jgi:hypothetical protein
MEIMTIAAKLKLNAASNITEYWLPFSHTETLT